LASAIFAFVLTINNNYTKSGNTKGKNGIPEQPKISQKNTLPPIVFAE